MRIGLLQLNPTVGAIADNVAAIRDGWEQAKADAFRLIDLPRTATMLAQGAGRLIRSASDRGVLAVFDPRLATAKRYRWTLVEALPPMRRTKDRAEAESLLQAIAAQ